MRFKTHVFVGTAEHTAEQSDRYASLDKLLGPALTAIRLSKGLTQQQLAERLTEATGKTARQGYINRLEKGEKMPSTARLGQILDCLNVGFAQLDEAIELSR
jgi:transcriptional regulator with XRE-family HTH domain